MRTDTKQPSSSYTQAISPTVLRRRRYAMPLTATIREIVTSK